MNTQRSTVDEVVRLVFIGSALLGLGLGLLLEIPEVGVLVGMGVGALVNAFIKKGAKEGVELKKELGK